MKNKAIVEISRQLNRGSYLRSMSIILAAFAVCCLFSVIPYLCLKLFSTAGLGSALIISGKNIYPVLTASVFMLFTFIEFIILSTVSMGENAWYSGRLTKKRNCGKRLRFWFSPVYSFKAFRLSALIFLLKLMWTLALLSPALLLFSSAAVIAFNGGIELPLLFSLGAGGFLLLITGLIFRFIIVQRYFLAPYLMSDNPKLKVIQAVKQSKNLSDGQIFRIVRFKFRFLPAFLTYPLIFPAIFFHPHYKQGCSIIAKELCL